MNIGEFLKSAVESFTSTVIEPLSHVGIIDVIDILTLAFLLFCVYRFIRNRRAGKLALGLLLIVLVLVLSAALNMKAIGFVLQNFYQVGIIAVLIIFQPELRAALEKVGNNPMLSKIKDITTGERRQYMSDLSRDVDSICDAVFAMSREKVGALIVIERKTKLGEYIDTGVTLNAQISSDLLKNIFFKNAPLHDGAVIIRDMRVYAAGCFLRISEQEGLDNELGTRHRAALGVSEVSDAPVIVVSEESGKVSMALDGKITRGYDRDTLRKTLFNLMASNFKKQKPEREVKHDE